MQCLPRTVDSHSGKCFISIYISNPGLLHCRQTLYHLSHQGSLYPLGLLIIIIMIWSKSIISILQIQIPAAAAKSLQSCLTPCDPIEGSPSGSTIPGILQARTLEWVAISFSSAWKWKVKVKLLSCVRLLATPWTAAYQAPPSMGFSRQEYWSGVPLPSLTDKDTECQIMLSVTQLINCGIWDLNLCTSVLLPSCSLFSGY